MEDQSARSKVDRSASRRHVRMQCSINVTAIFPRLSCRKAVQRTDDHLRRVFCAPRSIPAFPHAPPAGTWSSLLALVSACQGQYFFCELNAVFGHRSEQQHRSDAQSTTPSPSSAMADIQGGVVKLSNW